MSAALSPPNETIQTMNAPQLQSNLQQHATALPRARSEQGKDQSNFKKKDMKYVYSRAGGWRRGSA